MARWSRNTPAVLHPQQADPGRSKLTATTSRVQALHLLASCAEGVYAPLKKNQVAAAPNAPDCIPPTRLVRARRWFEDKLKSAAGVAMYEPGPPWHSGEVLDVTPPIAYWFICYAWFEYLASGLSEDGLRAAESIFERAHNIMRARLDGCDAERYHSADRNGTAVAIELCHGSRSELHFLHACHSAARPRALRGVLRSTSTDASCEPVLLHSAFCRGAAWERARWLREMLCANSCRAASVDGAGEFLAIIGQELNHQTAPLGPQSATIARLRWLFEHALRCAAAQRTVLLWRLYLRFEMASEGYPNAKRVYYRAVHTCPWSKQLWLDALRPPCRNVFAERELDDIRKLMLEKGFHFRVDP